jgi:hypothetical protein
MGNASDQLRDQASNIANEQIERAKSATDRGLNEAEALSESGDTATSEVPVETSLVPDAEHTSSPSKSNEYCRRATAKLRVPALTTGLLFLGSLPKEVRRPEK